MKSRISIIAFILFAFLFASCADESNTTPTDETITAVKIGNQEWSAKNLNVDHYRNGDPIPEVKDSAEWENLTTGAWCYYNNNPANGPIYGKLYNWYAVNDPRGLAPEGWHVPTDEEWTELENFLGGKQIAGGKLKEAGISHWLSPNNGATNESSFTALPGGWRNGIGGFDYIYCNGYWWTTTVNSEATAWGKYLNFYVPTCVKDFFSKVSGFSVRCVKD